MLFPEPLAPIIATNSPGSTARFDAVQHGELGAVAANKSPHQVRAASRIGHHSARIASTGTRRAARRDEGIVASTAMATLATTT